MYELVQLVVTSVIYDRYYRYSKWLGSDILDLVVCAENTKSVAGKWT